MGVDDAGKERKAIPRSKVRYYRRRPGHDGTIGALLPTNGRLRKYRCRFPGFWHTATAPLGVAWPVSQRQHCQKSPSRWQDHGNKEYIPPEDGKPVHRYDRQSRSKAVLTVYQKSTGRTNQRRNFHRFVGGLEDGKRSSSIPEGLFAMGKHLHQSWC